MGTHLGKCVASCEGGSYHPEPHQGNLKKKKKITDISPVNSIHVGKSCQQEQGHSFKLMSASSDRLWMAEWRCSGRNKALCHRASLLSVIDHRQNQQLSFVKDSFLLPHFLSPFPCLSLSQRSLLLTS